MSTFKLGRKMFKLSARSLKKLHSLRRRKETVVFQDETGFSLHPRLGRGWSKRGKRLRVPTTSQHRQRLNVSGWVAPLLGRKGLIRTARGNTDGFLEILQHIYEQLPKYDVWLYVDRARWHRGEKVRLFLECHERIHLQYLPPYQPALNPQERLWRQGRYEVTRNICFQDLDTLYAEFEYTIIHWPRAKIKRLCITI